MEKVNSQNMIESETIIHENDLAFEFMMNHLRLIDGFTIQSFEEKTGLTISSIKKELKTAVDKKRHAELLDPFGAAETLLDQRVNGFAHLRTEKHLVKSNEQNEPTQPFESSILRYSLTLFGADVVQ